jgi:hypothetical protein
MARYRITGIAYFFYALLIGGLSVYMAFFLEQATVETGTPAINPEIFKDRTDLHWHIIRTAIPFSLFLGLTLLLERKIRETNPFVIQYGFFGFSWIFMFFSLSNIISIVVLLHTKPGTVGSVYKVTTAFGILKANLPKIEMIASTLFLTVLLIQLVASIYISMLSARRKNSWYYIAFGLMITSVALLFPLWFKGKDYIASLL